MPRQARVDIPGALHHIICRGIESRDVFFDDADRDDFMSRLVEITSKSSTRCYSWALLPNHFHLLLQTGLIPIATVMQRLLTGYAGTFNRRHNRSGHLFQNRYKSILCQKEQYLLELIRYIHLNPIRAGVVSSFGRLKDYRYCGHGCILGFAPDLETWMAVAEILGRFGKRRKESRRRYESFIRDGVTQGRRPELTGGGLVRSCGGWRVINSLRRDGVLLKSDERILGDSDFVSSVLDTAEERFERRSEYGRKDIDLDKLIIIVAKLLEMDTDEVLATGKHPLRVEARSLLCYWAVKELGCTTTAVAKRLRVSQPAVTLAVHRGERIAAERGWLLQALLEGNL